MAVAASFRHKENNRFHSDVVPIAVTASFRHKVNNVVLWRRFRIVFDVRANAYSTFYWDLSGSLLGRFLDTASSWRTLYLISYYCLSNSTWDKGQPISLKTVPPQTKINITGGAIRLLLHPVLYDLARCCYFSFVRLNFRHKSDTFSGRYVKCV